MTFLVISEWTSHEVSAFFLQQGNHATLKKLALEARRRNIDGATLASMASSLAALQRLFHSWGCPVPKPLGRQLFLCIMAACGSEEVSDLSSNPSLASTCDESASTGSGTVDAFKTDTRDSAKEKSLTSVTHDTSDASRAPSSTCDMTAGRHAVKVPRFFKAWMQAKSSLWVAQHAHVRDLAMLMDDIQRFYHQLTRNVFSGGRAFAEAVAKLVLGVPQHVFLSVGQALQKMRAQGLIQDGASYYSPDVLPDDVACALERVRCECNKLHSLRLDQHHHAAKPQVVECLLTLAEFVLTKFCLPTSAINNPAADMEHFKLAEMADSALTPSSNDSTLAETRRGSSPVASRCTSPSKTYHDHVFGVLGEGTGFFDEHVFTTIDTHEVEKPSFGSGWTWSKAGMPDDALSLGDTQPLATLFKTPNGSAATFHHEALQSHHAAMQRHNHIMTKFQERFANFGGLQAS